MSASFPASERAHPVLSILIVNFNSTDVLRDCLDAIAASTIADRLETIVVDNASADFDVEELKSRYPWVTWLPQTTNTTYTGGNNIAFARSTADLVLMLNPDTRVELEALETAVAHMHATPDLAGLGAYLIGPDGQLQRYYRRLPTLADLPVLLFEPLFRRSRRGRQFLMTDEGFVGETTVEHVAAAFLVIRREAIAGSLLDAGYFNLLSDLDLSRRLNRIGRVAVFSDVRCYHEGGGGGLATPDPIARLRLHQDLTWGLRRYFRQQFKPVGQCLLNAGLVAYWIARVVRQALHQPRLAGAALVAGGSALLGKAPRY